MALASIALVVSVLALLVSGAAAKYTRDQAKSAADQTALAATQLHRAQTPDLEAGVEFSEGDQTAGTLVIRHADGPDLDSVDIEIVVPGGPPVDLPVPTFGPGNHTRTASLGALRQGATERVGVILNATHPDTAAVFRFTCHRGGEEAWTITRSVVPDWPPSIIH
jgi:hypothetical protein